MGIVCITTGTHKDASDTHTDRPLQMAGVCETSTVTSADNTREHSLSQSLGLNSGPIWVCKKKKQAQKKTQNRRSIIIYESCCKTSEADSSGVLRLISPSYCDQNECTEHSCMDTET
jgi:hypothetical protein